MAIVPNRQVVMSVVQYQKKIENGELTCLDLLDKAKELGVDGVELRREPWENYRDELQQVREKAEKLEKIIIYATFSRLICKDEESEKMLFHDIDIASEIGSPFLRVYLGETPPDSSDRWDVVRKAIAYAHAKGIFLVLENCSYMPGATLDEMLHAVQVIKSPLLKINVDVGNYFMNGIDCVNAISKLKDRIIYTHLKNPSSPEGVLGGGAMPMNHILDVLDALPQKVYYCFEFGGGPNPEEKIEKSLQFLKTRLR